MYGTINRHFISDCIYSSTLYKHLNSKSKLVHFSKYKSPEADENLTESERQERRNKPKSQSFTGFPQ